VVPGAVLQSSVARAWAFIERYHTVFGNETQLRPMITEDFTFFDPIDGDYEIKGRDAFVSLTHDVATRYPTVKRTTTAATTAGDQVAFEVTFPHFWPPIGAEPATHDPARSLEVFSFRGQIASSFDMWFEAGTMQAARSGCFGATPSCASDVAALAQRYVTAWASGDRAAVGALYRRDATFTDPVLGLKQTGPAAIAGTTTGRFGNRPRITVLDVYVQTAGPNAPSSTTDAQGQLIAIAIKFRVDLTAGGGPHTIVAVTTLDLGTRTGGGFDRDPNGLIVQEVVHHDLAGLVAAGLVVGPMANTGSPSTS
jgi:uncharacterized protein (TIGR02246 family)